MKKLIIFILLLVAGVSQAQQPKMGEWLDSLTSSRTAFKVDIAGSQIVTVDFRALTTADTVRVYNFLDSASGYNATKFTRDTIPVSMKNLGTNADLADPETMIRNIASPLEVEVQQRNVNKLFFKSGDTALDHTIYIRIRYIYY